MQVFGTCYDCIIDVFAVVWKIQVECIDHSISKRCEVPYFDLIFINTFEIQITQSQPVTQPVCIGLTQLAEIKMLRFMKWHQILNKRYDTKRTWTTLKVNTVCTFCGMFAQICFCHIVKCLRKMVHARHATHGSEI